MSTNSSDLIFDLSCLQGQIADVGIGLQGLETQRLLNPELYVTDSEAEEDTKKYIHDLASFINSISSSGSAQELSKGLSTFYISEFLYNAMLTLNKFVNEVEYDNSYKITGAKGGVKPFNKTFSQDLYRLIKKGQLMQTSLHRRKIDSSGQPNIDFNAKDVTNSFAIKTREDLLVQTNFMNYTNTNSFRFTPKLEEVWTNSYKVVIPTTFMTSDNDFGNNMRKLITDLYKEYYYNEIVEIQKRLNKEDAPTNLDTNLRIKLQEVRNAFTREIYSPDTDISSEFPLSDIITELNDFINDMENQIDKYEDTLMLFDKPENQDKLGLYEFIEEKSHMLNQTGNAYHYALELSKRIQRISDYTYGKDSSLGPNPHFNDISEFNEDACIKGIDEALAILSNLTNDLHLTTGDNMDSCSFAVITNTAFDNALINIEDIYHKYINFANDNSNQIFSNNVIDFNSNQLDSLGIIDVLKEANLLHYGQNSSNFEFDYIYDGDSSLALNYSQYNKNYRTQTYYCNTKVSRYQNEYLYRTFSLIVIKIAIALAVLYIFRNIQVYNLIKQQANTKSLRSTKDNEIERLLSKKIPKDLTITDYTTITNLRRKLEKMKMQLRAETDKNTNFDFGLPISPYDDAKTDKNGNLLTTDSLYVCYTNILDLMNYQVTTGNDKLTDSVVIESAFGRLYPFTRSMLYQYDEYFSIKESKYNPENDSSSEIKFGTILNGLNYVAQSVARNKYNYQVGDLEKTLTKIIYLCTCLTVNWSDQDTIKTTSLDNIQIEESPLNDIMTFDHSGDYGLFINKELNMTKAGGTSGDQTAFKTTILGFIHGEMKRVVNSNLPWVVKYVYWLSLYCINAYFIHLMKKDITAVVVAVKDEN